jgi:hypothetical protein
MFSFLSSQHTQRIRMQQAFNQLHSSSDNGENYRPAEGVALKCMHQDGTNGLKIEMVQQNQEAMNDLLKQHLTSMKSYFQRGSSISAMSWFQLKTHVSSKQQKQDLTAIVGLNTFGMNGIVTGLNARTCNVNNNNYQNTRVITNAERVEFVQDAHYRTTSGWEWDGRIKAATLMDGIVKPPTLTEKVIPPFNGSEMSLGKAKSIAGIPVDTLLTIRTDPQQFTSLACLIRPSSMYSLGALATVGRVSRNEGGKPQYGGGLRLISNWQLYPGVHWNNEVEMGPKTIVSSGVRLTCPSNQTNCNLSVRVPCNNPQDYKIGLSFNIGD